MSTPQIGSGAGIARPLEGAGGKIELIRERYCYAVHGAGAAVAVKFDRVALRTPDGKDGEAGATAISFQPRPVNLMKPERIAVIRLRVPVVPDLLLRLPAHPAG